MKSKTKIGKRYNISIAISLIIVALVAINIFRINYTNKESKYISEKGVLDLTGWDVDEEKILKLDGEWEFYPGKLLEPNEDFKDQENTYIKVPGDWGPYLNLEALKNGSGTYRLIIKVPEDRIYGIKARTIRFANRIYFNGEKIAQVGEPSTEDHDFVTVSRYSLGAGKSLDGEIELLVHVTSLNYRTGGILKSLEIGSFDSMITMDNKNLTLDALVVAICFTLGLYFFVIYLQRSKTIYLAYFSLLNILTGLYFSTMNEQILSLIYDYKPIARTQIQGTLIILTCICFLKFIHHFFRELSSKRITNGLTTFMISLLIFSVTGEVIESPISFMLIQNISSVGIGLTYIYISFILIKAMLRKTDLVEYLLITVVSISAYWIILFIKIFSEISLGNIPMFLILITMFSISALMSHQLQLDYQMATNMYEKLSRDDKLKDEFLMKTSHEFRRPLQLMSNLTQYLLEGKKGSITIKQQENLFQIQQETDKLKRITDDLLDASLIKSGEIKLRVASINPYKIAEEILKEIETLIPNNKPVFLKNNIIKDFPLLMADPDKFKQIIYDLVHNAVKYTESGDIIISARIVDNKAEIKVEDSGRGIEEKYLKEVFDKFFQKNLKEDPEQGLGLGLSIVKDLVEIQGGEIYVESKVGEGSSFIFTLPLSNNKELQEEGLYKDKCSFIMSLEERILSNFEDETPDSLNLEKILIVDNNKSNQNFLYSIINDLDCSIIIANSGKEALKIIKEDKIDLVILDFMLPDMKSSQLCTEIRKEYSIGELPILILTASGRTKDLIGTFNYGANDFQRKPVDPEELKSRIQSLLLIKSTAEEGLEKEFQYFYSQISPHFLYNTLNSIIGLSYVDTEKTRQALNNLSVYLRGKLDIHRKKGFVSLESELELVIAYLEIEELRFGERLKVIYHIDKELDAKIPPLTLQPIVENAIYHGIARVENGKIEVSTKREKDGLISITIKDNGKGMTEGEKQELLKGNGKGIGFKNVMERIKLLKGASLILESNIGEGATVKIIIPGVRDNEYYENNFD